MAIVINPTDPVNSAVKQVVIPSAPIAQLIRAYNIVGIRPPVVRSNEFDGKIDQTTYKEPELYKSALGTPVVINLKFKSVAFTDYNTGKKYTTDEIVLDCVLCTVSRPSIIVKTQINGRNGTVKEYIGKDDHQVTINGIIVGNNGQFPEDQIIALRRMADAPKAIPVESRYLNALGVFNLVVVDFNAPQEAGGISRLNFTISAVSDEPLQLQLS